MKTQVFSPARSVFRQLHFGEQLTQCGARDGAGAASAGEFLQV